MSADRISFGGKGDEVIAHWLQPGTQFGDAATQLVDALTDMIEPVVRRFGRSRRLVVIEMAGEFTFYLVQRGAARLLVDAAGEHWPEGRLQRLAGNGVELRLAPHRIVSSTLHLPSGGYNYVEPIIENRLDRLMPWTAEKALYGFSIGPAAEEDRTMSVQFSATARAFAEQCMARLKTMGLATSAIGSAGESIENQLAINLLGKRDRSARRRLRGRTGLSAALLVAVTLILFASSSFIERRAENRLTRLEQELSSERAQVMARGTNAGDERAQQLIDAKRGSLPAIVFIDRLAALIPADTYLTELEISDNGIALSGSSPNAPALIRLLESEADLTAVTFAAPLSRGEDGRDRFEITAGRLDTASDAAVPLR